MQPKLKEADKEMTALTNGKQKSSVGKLTFQEAKTTDVLNLIPLGSANGRFAKIRLEVQEMTNNLAADKSAVIKAPRRSMDWKEAKSITTNVNMMLTKNKKPWKMLFNPLKSLFLLVRKADLAKVQKGV